MADKEPNFRSMVLTLFLVTLGAGLTLGFVYQITKQPIKQAKLEKKTNAIRKVLPEFTNNPYQEAQKVAVQNDTFTVFPATKNGKKVGVAILARTDKGFSGTIKLMVGFHPDGTINQVAVVQHQETPGLGDKIEGSKSDFSEQFKGKNPSEFELRVKKDDGDVNAITASTISSRAYCHALRRAWKAYKSQ